jgi:hypothetical protein
MDLTKSEEFFGWFTASITIFFHLTKVSPSIKLILGKMNFKDIPTMYITSLYYNNLIWYIYGKTIFNYHIKIGFFASGALCLFSIIIYLIYEIREYIFDVILNVIIVSMSSWGIYRYLTIVIDDDFFIGKIGICTSIAFYICSTYLLYSALKDKKFDLYKIINIFFYLIISFCWVVYAIITTDFYLSITFICGILISIMQSSLYFNLKKRYSLNDIRDVSNTVISIENNVSEANKSVEQILKNDENVANNVKII